jgi:hypothetical protein
MVPANRIGFESGRFTASQRKISKEGITLTVFVFFSIFYLDDSIKWNYIESIRLILFAVFLLLRIGISRGNIIV